MDSQRGTHVSSLDSGDTAVGLLKVGDDHVQLSKLRDDLLIFCIFLSYGSWDSKCILSYLGAECD